MPPSTIAVMIRPLLRCSGERASSSMANTTPANGVLKAAAIPAAPPATNRPCTFMRRRSGTRRRACSMTPAAICTDGPSRPSDNPPSRPPVVRAIFARLRRRETNSPRVPGPESSAAMTWGMPEPAAPGTNRRVSQTMPAASRGVHSSGNHQPMLRRSWKMLNACSASAVNATMTRPEATASATTTARAHQVRQSENSVRIARRQSCPRPPLAWGGWGGSCCSGGGAPGSVGVM